MTRVTVAICTYNRCEMLKEAIESVLAQTYSDMKVVVLDNCSTDGTREVVGLFADERLSYVRNEENLGMVGNWNRAIELCDTEYLNVFHDDDRMFPWMIEEEVRILDENPDIEIVGSGVVHVMGEGKLPKKPARFACSRFGKGEFVKAYVRRASELLAPSVLFRTKETIASGIRFRPEVGLSADVYFWLELNALGAGVCMLCAPIFEYRKHKGATSVMSNLEHVEKTLMELDKFIKGRGLGKDAGALREAWVGMLMRTCVDKIYSEDGLSNIRRLRERLSTQHEWNVSDASFNDILAVLLLGQIVTQIGKGEASFGDYLSERAKARTLGVSIPVMRECKWFLKYVLMKRLV